MPSMLADILTSSRSQTRGEAHECVGRALIEAIESKQDSYLSEDDVKSALGTMYLGMLLVSYRVRF